MHLAAGLSVGLTGLAAGYAIGVVGDMVRKFTEIESIAILIDHRVYGPICSNQECLWAWY